MLVSLGVGASFSPPFTGRNAGVTVAQTFLSVVWLDLSPTVVSAGLQAGMPASLSLPMTAFPFVAFLYFVVHPSDAV